MTHQYSPQIQEISLLVKAIADKFGNLPQVLAVALAGSRTTGVSNPTSDYDFYVYIQEEIPVETREIIAKEFAQRLEINNQFWEVGDEWIDNKTGCRVDIMYRTPQWIEQQLERVLIKHQASVGYSTCFWWNVLTSANLYDKTGWFNKLQQQADQPYPEPLKKAIIAKNYPILRTNISSYTKQIESAINRNDSLSIIHRTAVLLASYFDIIFAINSIPHPGEKRLLQQLNKLCSKIPENMENQICAIHDSIASPANLLDHLNTLIAVDLPSV
ncbi:MAG: nucleotidyltransferase domain-containing protein [Potamolinea sp.]